VNYEILRTNRERDRLLAYVDRAQSAQELEGATHGFINTGWYVMNRSVRDMVDDVVPISNEVHLWPRIAASGKPVGFYSATEPWFDSGTHERLARVSEYIESLEGKSFITSMLRKK
jgi:NDP-sugar pyrophosphorylase family protein